MRKFASIAILVLALFLANPAGAVHNSGKTTVNYWVDVATDGFDDGYYFVVWSNSTGVYGSLYYVKNNTPFRNVTVRTVEGYSVAIESMMNEKWNGLDMTQNHYLVVWKESDDSHLHWRLYEYDGDPLGGSELYDYDISNYLDVAYGGGYYVVVLGKSSTAYNNELRYVSINSTNGNKAEEGLLFNGSKLYPSDGAIYRATIAYNSELGTFGVAFIVSDGSGYGVHFVSFKLNTDGTLDGSSIRNVSILDPNIGNVWWTAVAPTTGGFLVAYGNGTKEQRVNWYVRMVSVSDSGLSVSGGSGPYPNTQRAGKGTLSFVWNGTYGTNSYVLMVLEERNNPDDPNDPFYLTARILDLGGNLRKDLGIIVPAGDGSKRNPALVSKPSNSPETYVLAWIDSTNRVVQNSEYFADLSEVSESTPVLFFSSLAIATATLLGILWLFRRK